MVQISERTEEKVQSSSSLSSRLAAWIQGVTDTSSSQREDFLWAFERHYIRKLSRKYTLIPMADRFDTLVNAMVESFQDALWRLENLPHNHALFEIKNVRSHKVVEHFVKLLEEMPWHMDLRWIVLSFNLLNKGKTRRPFALLEPIVEEDPQQIIWMVRAGLFYTYKTKEDQTPIFRRYLRRLKKRNYNLKQVLKSLEQHQVREVREMAWLALQIEQGQSFCDFSPSFKNYYSS